MMVLMNLSGEQSGWLHRSKRLAIAIKALLDAQVLINQVYLSLHDVPPLYRSGVRYMNEPKKWLIQGYPIAIEEFACIPEIIKRGFGDCDDLAPWRCAELRRAGEKAKIRITWKANPVEGGKLFHIVVRRADGSIEDPSLKLGMRG